RRPQQPEVTAGEGREEALHACVARTRVRRAPAGAAGLTAAVHTAAPRRCVRCAAGAGASCPRPLGERPLARTSFPPTPDRGTPFELRGRLSDPLTLVNGSQDLGQLDLRTRRFSARDR